MMALYLPQSLAAWGQPHFGKVLKGELEALPLNALPLHLGTTQGGMVAEEPITVVVTHTRGDEVAIVARASLFFTEIVINCGCGDDPMSIPAHCVMEIILERGSGVTTMAVVDE